MIPDVAKLARLDVLAQGSALADLKLEMARSVPDPDRVAALAPAAIKQLDQLIGALEAGKLDAAGLDSLKADLAARKADPKMSWDVATQNYLALQALGRAGLVGDGPALQAKFDLLRFPEKPALYDSPRSRDVSPAPER
jgi:hypothetical protein